MLPSHYKYLSSDKVQSRQSLCVFYLLLRTQLKKWYLFSCQDQTKEANNEKKSKWIFLLSNAVIVHDHLI